MIELLRIFKSVPSKSSLSCWWERSSFWAFTDADPFWLLLPKRSLLPHFSCSVNALFMASSSIILESLSASRRAMESRVSFALFCWLINLSILEFSNSSSDLHPAISESRFSSSRSLVASSSCWYIESFMTSSRVMSEYNIESKVHQPVLCKPLDFVADIEPLVIDMPLCLAKNSSIEHVILAGFGLSRKVRHSRNSPQYVIFTRLQFVILYNLESSSFITSRYPWPNL